MSNNFLRSPSGWFRRFWLVLLGLLSLGSSHAEDATSVLTTLGTDTSSKAQSYGTAVIALLAVVAALILVVLIASALLSILSRRD